MSAPRIGDVWVGEDHDGSEIRRTVTAVEPPVTDPKAHNFYTGWSIALDGSSLSHLGWWYGQGWCEDFEECPCCSERATLVGCRSGYSACEACRVQMPGGGAMTAAIVARLRARAEREERKEYLARVARDGSSLPQTHDGLDRCILQYAYTAKALREEAAAIGALPASEVERACAFLSERRVSLDGVHDKWFADGDTMPQRLSAPTLAACIIATAKALGWEP